MKESLLENQSQWLNSYKFGVRITEIGHVVSVGDGIAWITGLPGAAIDDILLMEDGSQANVFDLTPDIVGAILLYQTEQLTAGVIVHRTKQLLSIPVGNGLLGRIVDPLGTPMDGQGELKEITGSNKLEIQSSPITARDFVHEPLYSGVKIIDTMIPIGKGQRQLIIGDEGLGRTSLAIDTVINQNGKNVYCVYVMIGQKRSSVVKVIETLRKHNALEYTAVVIAEANALPGLQYLAPYAGCSIAEAWMRQGLDTLVVYDDLSTHARIYRELSLLLRRPPGREAYPGDIFSIHARLLERTSCLNASHGKGSMTALPIVETQEGEISAYIPTNLISITDGQIYLDQKLFSSGHRPAIDIAKSVSRIGGQAQHERIKAEAGRMKLEYLQFLELEVFTRFGARLEKSMEVAIQRGYILREILKQEELSPVSIEFQMAWLVAFNDGLFDSVEIESIHEVLEKITHHVKKSQFLLDSTREDWSNAVHDWFKLFIGLNHEPSS
jgi:F-type H+-transporting ATPase subunit alpha